MLNFPNFPNTTAATRGVQTKSGRFVIRTDYNSRTKSIHFLIEFLICSIPTTQFSVSSTVRCFIVRNYGQSSTDNAYSGKILFEINRFFLLVFFPPPP